MPLPSQASLAVVAREWTRIGLTGFGGPPAHIALLRRLVVERKQWIDEREFEQANAACGLLPGPASTQLAIYCAYRVAGLPGALIGGLGFIAPAIVLILALAALFLATAPPRWVAGAGAGAGAVVAAVAVFAAASLLGPSFERARVERARSIRWTIYVVTGAVAAALIGPYLVLVLLGCGLAELGGRGRFSAPLAVMTPKAAGFGALAWTALKVGALSFGGGFVIVPLMQADAVHTYHWMTNTQFLNAVALGQVTPGPVVATVAAVGYRAHGLGGGLMAAAIAFTPSFVFVLLGGRRFLRLRRNVGALAFLDGAGPAAIGAIAGAAIPLAGALQKWWQIMILISASLILAGARTGVVRTLLLGGFIGAVAGLTGASLPYDAPRNQPKLARGALTTRTAPRPSAAPAPIPATPAPTPGTLRPSPEPRLTTAARCGGGGRGSTRGGQRARSARRRGRGSPGSCAERTQRRPRNRAPGRASGR